MHGQHRRVSHSPDQRTVYVGGVNALEELGEVPSAAHHQVETRSVSRNTEESLTAMAVFICLQEGMDELCPRLWTPFRNHEVFFQSPHWILFLLSHTCCLTGFLSLHLLQILQNSTGSLNVGPWLLLQLPLMGTWPSGCGQCYENFLSPLSCCPLPWPARYPERNAEAWWTEVYFYVCFYYTHIHTYSVEKSEYLLSPLEGKNILARR